MNTPETARPPDPRLPSLDQFRGYTVAAMFLVNFAGAFSATPALLRHHNTWCSFADTVMPQFFFAAGMALRLVMLRDQARHGPSAARRRGLRRGLLLVLIGWVFYQDSARFADWQRLTSVSPGDFMREVFLTHSFQALTHIGVTTLWVLPVIAASARTRILFALGSGALHAGLSAWFWYETLHRWRVIDGGPLGFLTWTLPVIAGSLALDVVRGALPGIPGRLLRSGALLMAAGYGLACLTAGGTLAAPPFVPPWHPPDLWTMSQRAGSVSYLMFSSGFSLAVCAAFVRWSDLRGRSLPLFTDLGMNALAAYLIHMVVMGALSPVAPRDAPLWWAAALTAAGFLLSWGATRWCNRRKLFLRL